MGTLGRDIAFWLFTGSAITSLVWHSIMPAVASVAFAALFFYHFLAERPRAIRKSRAKGLQITTLVPLTPLVVRLHLFLSGRKITGKWVRVYEIHIPDYAGPDFVRRLAQDLALIEKTFPRPAVYFWETPAPVPSAIRQFIREKAKEGLAYWIREASPAPKTLSCGFGRKEKTHVRRGAILLD